MRISARLINGADGVQVWAADFREELKDVFALQDKIADLVARKLSLKLGAAALAAPVNPEVFQLYLEGKQEAKKRNEAGYAKAQRAYERAIALDPKFARAHAGLAEVWYLRGQAVPLESEAGQKAADNAQEAVKRALALDPNLAEAYTTRGMLSRRVRDDAATEADFRRALSLNPNDAAAHQHYGFFVAQKGNPAAGLAELELAMRLDPFAPIIPAIYAGALAQVRRWAESLAAYERSLAIQPDFERAHFERVRPLIFLNRRSEAIALARDWAERDSSHGNYSRLTAIIGLALAGERATAEKLAEPYLARSSQTGSSDILTLYFALGRTDEGLNYFERHKFVRLWGTSFTNPAYKMAEWPNAYDRNPEHYSVLAPSGQMLDAVSSLRGASGAHCQMGQRRRCPFSPRQLLVG